MKKKVVIIGAGPTGLGAAIRLRELNDPDVSWNVLEKNGFCGGLSATEEDDKGFLWDMGGHITFSHYEYFDDILGYYVKDWVEHDRECWIWVKQIHSISISE